MLNMNQNIYFESLSGEHLNHLCKWRWMCNYIAAGDSCWTFLQFHTNFSLLFCSQSWDHLENLLKWLRLYYLHSIHAQVTYQIRWGKKVAAIECICDCVFLEGGWLGLAQLLLPILVRAHLLLHISLYESQTFQFCYLQSPYLQVQWKELLQCRSTIERDHDFINHAWSSAWPFEQHWWVCQTLAVLFEFHVVFDLR